MVKRAFKRTLKEGQAVDMKGSTYERRYKNVMPESFFFFYFVIQK